MGDGDGAGAAIGEEVPDGGGAIAFDAEDARDEGYEIAGSEFLEEEGLGLGVEIGEMGDGEEFAAFFVAEGDVVIGVGDGEGADGFDGGVGIA